MTQYKTSNYSLDFIKILEQDSFPLTHAMCEKNDYATGGFFTTVEIDESSWDKFKLVCIYERLPNNEIHINSFEVAKADRHKNYGKKFFRKLQTKYNKIYLHTLDSAKSFYLNLGFKTTEIHNELVWSKK